MFVCLFAVVDDLVSPMVPDLPEVNVSRVSGGGEGDFFYVVEGERGVYRSASLTGERVERERERERGRESERERERERE